MSQCLLFQCQLSFYVFDWDGTSNLDDDFLGSANFKMTDVGLNVFSSNLNWNVMHFPVVSTGKKTSVKHYKKRCMVIILVLKLFFFLLSYCHR